MLRRTSPRTERLGAELELAREIQESLLPGPSPPARCCSAVHAIFRPAAAVGGDYFDIFPLGDRRLMVVVGDVAGHGLHTGLLMASLKSTVAALVHEGYSGVELLARVNALLVRRRPVQTMATLAVQSRSIPPPATASASPTPAIRRPILIADGGGGGADGQFAAAGQPRSIGPGRIERPFPPGARLSAVLRRPGRGDRRVGRAIRLRAARGDGRARALACRWVSSSLRSSGRSTASSATAPSPTT